MAIDTLIKKQNYPFQKKTVKEMKKRETNINIIGDEMKIKQNFSILSNPPGSGKKVCLLDLIHSSNVKSKQIQEEKRINTSNVIVYTKLKMEEYTLIDTTLVIGDTNSYIQWKNNIDCFYPHTSVFYILNDDDILNIDLLNCPYKIIFVKYQIVSSILESVRKYKFIRTIISNPFLCNISCLPKSNYYWFVDSVSSNYYNLGEQTIEYNNKKIAINPIKTSNVMIMNNFMHLDNAILSDVICKINIPSKQVGMPIKRNRKVHVYENEIMTTIPKKNRIDKETYLSSVDNRYIHKIKEDDKCSICLDTIQNQCVLECCYTSYCLSCLHLWIQQHNSCPLCRNSEIQKHRIVFDNKHYRSKYDITLDILNKVSGTVLFVNLFCEYDDLCKTILRHSNKKQIDIKGACKYQDEMDKKINGADDAIIYFNRNNIHSCIVLHDVGHILFFHPISNTEVEKHIIGRTYRINRTKKLNIWRLVDCFKYNLNKK